MPEIPSSASKSPAARGSRQQHYSKKKKPADASQLPAISTREKSRFFPPFPSIGSGRASETQPLSHSQDSESGIGFRAGINLSTKLHQVFYSNILRRSIRFYSGDWWWNLGKNSLTCRSRRGPGRWRTSRCSEP
ncbi:uncharacterized protein LOC131222527 isoform X3 [Magnolia sinica]|uniref:uncharacterized protein LOC131222527 isoform X3 n=1 Tax=Magnolia sinica TaxID=86752 RepID=UPI0026595040|nr:uncharacterized protein LOC131222527 isoform X3 [Magnolia sinica]